MIKNHSISTINEVKGKEMSELVKQLVEEISNMKREEIYVVRIYAVTFYTEEIKKKLVELDYMELDSANEIKDIIEKKADSLGLSKNNPFIDYLNMGDTKSIIKKYLEVEIITKEPLRPCQIDQSYKDGLEELLDASFSVSSALW